MIKVNKKVIVSIALIIITIFILSNNVFAYFNPGVWEPNKNNGNGGIFLIKAGTVLGWIQFLGVVIAVLALAFIGIKYLLSSVEGKAEYKKTMWPYVIGCFMLMGISLVIQIIEDVAKI